MSELIVKVCRIDKISEHSNADSLEIAHIGAWTTCVKKDVFKVGQTVVFIPPDAILPESLHTFLGITKYCGEMPKDSEEYKQGRRRVRATRLRGERSFGTLMTTKDVNDYLEMITEVPVFIKECGLTTANLREGDNIAELLQITKYTPPEKVRSGDAASNHPLFHQYTDIERYQNYPDMLNENDDVVLTEKSHGTSCRVGLIRINDEEVQWMCGSHRVNRKQWDAKGNISLYWRPLTGNMQEMLAGIQHDHKANSAIAFLEICGPGIQDMHYDGKLNFLVFDISVDGNYLDWDKVEHTCGIYGVPTVPVLYKGPFSEKVLMEHTDGPTCVCENVVSKFKGREGVVVKPLHERRTPNGDRVILKSVSVDYLNRKGASDNA